MASHWGSGLGHSKPFILFLFSHSEVDLLWFLWSFCAWASHQRLVSRYWASGFSCREHNSWLCQWSFNYGKPWSSKVSPNYPHRGMLCHLCARGTGTHVVQNVHSNIIMILLNTLIWGHPRCCFFTNVTQGFMFLLIVVVFCLATLPWIEVLPLVFFYGGIGTMNADLVWREWGLQFLRCSSGSFVTFWMSHWCAPGGFFSCRQAKWFLYSHSGSLESPSLRNVFVTPSRCALSFHLIVAWHAACWDLLAHFMLNAGNV